MNILNLYDNLYYAGGVVRDFLLGKESPDVDITVLGDAIEFCKSLDFGEIVQINPEFSTVRMKIDDKFYDFASTRKEIYPKKGHLPEVIEIGCSLKEDVLRRDFTLNSLMRNLKTGEVIDYVSGINDLKNKELRVLHDKSFVDDPTRILRGLKFSVRFGFKLEENTKKLQEMYLNDINYDMSYKRVKDEIMSVFNLNSNKAFELFEKQKIYKLLTQKEIVFPKYDIQNLVEKYSTKVKNVWIVYVGLVDTEKLELTKIEKKIVQDFEKLLKMDFDDEFEMAKVFSKCEIESLLMYEIKTENKKAIKYLDCLSKIKLEITGTDLKNLGMTPSEKYSELFDVVLKAKFKNPNMTKKEEIALVEKLLQL